MRFNSRKSSHLHRFRIWQQQTILIWIIVILISVHLGASRAPPRILASNLDEFGAISIPVSNTLSLTCEGDEPVRWITHGRKDIAERTDEQTSNEITVDNKYQSILVVSDTVYTDTGNFICYYKDSVNSVQPADKAEIYVFVKDPSNILLPASGPSNMDFVSAQLNMESIIRCLPTGSDVNVTLWKGTKPYGKPLSVNNVELQFNPTRGFIITLVTILHSDNFYCTAQLGSVSDIRYFFIQVLPNTDAVPMPSISQEAKYATKGSRFIISCSVRSLSSVLLFLEWAIPAEQDSKRIKIGQEWSTEYNDSQGGKYKETKRNVTILSVESVDQGTYTCIARDHTGKSNDKAVYIEVKESGESFIKFSLGDGDPNQAFELKLGSPEVKFAVNVEAHPPNPSLDWFKGSTKLSNSNKYNITITGKIAVLVVYNLSRKDSGYYNLVGKTGKTTEELKLTLTVSEPPDVIIKPRIPMMHRSNEGFTINCFIDGCPKSNVTWYWSPCASPSSCARNYHVLTDSEENEEIPSEPKSEVAEGCPVQAVLSGIVHAAGYYMCVAENYVGKNSSEISVFIKEFQFNFHTTASSNWPYEQDNLVLDCYASKFYYSKIEWFWLPTGGNEPLKITNNSNILVRPSEETYTLLVNVSINPAVIESSGQYICRASELGTGKTEEKKELISVRKTVTPIIMETNLNSTEYTVFKQIAFEFICKASGVPEPEIKWYLNGSLIIPINDTAIQFLDGGSKLYIARTLPKDSGRYECTASNRAGAVLRNATLIVLDVETPGALSKGTVIGIVVFIIVAVVIIIVGGVFLGRRMYSERKDKQEWKQLQHQLFDQGDVGAYNPELPLDEQVETLPYDRSWEVPKERLRLGRTLGQGAFGRVVKGELLHVEKNEWQPVAVKMLKERSDSEQRRALMQELKIMIHIGRHINVVNLIGAVTKNISKGELQVLVEYCKYGNLRHFLLKHRDNFIDQINLKTGEFDRAVQRTGNVFRFSDVFNSSTTNSARTEITSATLDSGGGIDNTGARLSSITSPNPNSARQLTTYDLICYAYQISSGMIYLGSKKLVHRDLALRNILLAEGDVVKICDFGLAKDVYRKNYYRKRGQGPLPYKWMAIESMRDKVYTAESDVWSYSILLWEIFTLGANPYPGMEVDDEFYNKVNTGYRMEKPQMAPNSMYTLMNQCWLYEPKARPTFVEINSRISSIMDPDTLQTYQQKNEDYLLVDVGVHDNRDLLSSLSNDLEAYVGVDPDTNSQGQPNYINAEVDPKSPVQVNMQTGNVNYANLMHPTDVNGLNHQRALKYGEPMADRPELAPMIGSGHYQNPPKPTRVGPKKSAVSSGDQAYLDMGSKHCLDEDGDAGLANVRGAKASPRGSPPPRYTDVISSDQPQPWNS